MEKDATRKAFGSIQDILVAEFVTEARRNKSRPMCWVAYSPESWGPLLDSVLTEIPPIADRRYCYRAQTPDDEAIAHLSGLTAAPEGCEVRPADKALMESGLANVDEVRAEARKMWGSLDRFVTEGFGYCVVAGDAITSWSLTECPSGDRIDGSAGQFRTSVGVETVEEFRRRGHATAAAASTLLRCRREGIVADWDLYAGNTPSLKLAERLGLTRAADYPIRFFWFNRIDNLLVNGNVALKKGRAQDSAEWFGKAFEPDHPENEVKESLQLSTAARRAWWMGKAADAYEQAGMPGMSKDMRERAARETGSNG